MKRISSIPNTLLIEPPRSPRDAIWKKSHVNIVFTWLQHSFNHSYIHVIEAIMQALATLKSENSIKNSFSDLVSIMVRFMEATTFANAAQIPPEIATRIFQLHTWTDSICSVRMLPPPLLAEWQFHHQELLQIHSLVFRIRDLLEYLAFLPSGHRTFLLLHWFESRNSISGYKFLLEWGR